MARPLPTHLLLLLAFLLGCIWATHVAAEESCEGNDPTTGGVAESLAKAPATGPNIDPNGYLVYCPCMGRFGNQASQFLGTFAIAKALNRTLVVPPLIDFKHRGAEMTPFTEYFEIAPLNGYHRAISMEEFMAKVAPVAWPASERVMHCYSAESDPSKVTCNGKQGSPFGPFWDHYKVDFVKDYGFMASYSTPISEWITHVPASRFPVVALRGAPGKFPEMPEHRGIAEFIHWNKKTLGKARGILKSAGVSGPFLALHVRAGSDWTHACKGAIGNREYMASPQCHIPDGGITQDICLPPVKTLVKDIKKALSDSREIKFQAVYVGTDSAQTFEELKKAAAKEKSLQSLMFVMSSASDPLLDMCVFGLADSFIGNCVSSFTAFAARERTVKSMPVRFWGVYN